MWVICGAASLFFCVLGWWMTLKKHPRVMWAVACSLAFTGLTLLSDLRMVLSWVMKEDWGALADTMPTMYSMFAAFTIALLLGNLLTIVTNRK